MTLGALGPRVILDLPYSVQVVDADLTRNQRLISVREALRFIPSVQGENIRPQTGGIQAGVMVYSETEEGGYKQSGLGRMNGVAAMNDFIEYRTIVHEVALAPAAT